ncbi:carbonic anhydrase family protein [Hydrogenophaga sp.]|uniref:carbonic anhydrase family protein n=1 Tax=Hydrogenophaga sp. TaxID=1904254 RepID=UPI003F6B413C
MTFERQPRTTLLIGALLCSLATLTQATASEQPTLTLPAPAVRVPPVATPLPAKANKPGAPVAKVREEPLVSPAPKTTAGAPVPAREGAKGAEDLIKGDEDLRKLLLERIAGSGEVVLRSSDVAPPRAKRAGTNPRALTAADLAAVQRQAQAPEGHGHWDYAGAGGPEHWGKLQPGYATCAKGQRQSPIDIRESIQVALDPIEFDYRPSAFRVLDTGHTVQVMPARGSSIVVSGRRYELLQFHFHRPSEERVDGQAFDMVLHLVHRDLDGRLAVVAVLLTAGVDQPQIQQVWNNLPLERQVEVLAAAPMDLNQLLPDDLRYVTYMGSLTTPPCTEGVLWMVLKTPMQLSAEQIAIFAHLYPMNARPIQPANGRLIKEDR